MTIEAENTLPQSWHTIDSQINYNRSKNLFYRQNILRFAPETIACADKFCEIGNQELLISYTVRKALQEFCRVNQYMSFSEQDKASLSSLYSGLLDEIKAGKDSLSALADTHYRHIRDWLKKSNPFAEELYSNQGTHLEAVCCSEYNADLQIKLLHIDLHLLVEPVLDIGCGEQGILVHYLQKKRIGGVWY